MRRVNLTEAQVKKAVNDYLQIGANQGKWIFHRLQCGSRLIDYGDHKQKMQFCEAGTADYVVIQRIKHLAVIGVVSSQNPNEIVKVTYLEIKSSTGKQSPDQILFAQRAMKQNCRYYIIRNASQLEGIL